MSFRGETLLPLVGPGAATYPYPSSVTIDAQGRVTAIGADWTVAGVTMTGNLTMDTTTTGKIRSASNLTLKFQSQQADGAAAAAHEFDTSTAWTLGKLLDFKTNAVEFGWINTTPYLVATGSAVGMFTNSITPGAYHGLAFSGAQMNVAFNGGLYVTLDTASFRNTTDNTLDLGTTSLFWKSSFIRRYAHREIHASQGAGTYTVAANNGEKFVVTMTANITWAIDAGGVQGQIVTLQLKQDGTAGRTWTNPANVNFAGGAFAASAAIAANAWDSIVLQWNATTTEWDEIARAMNVGP